MALSHADILNQRRIMAMLTAGDFNSAYAQLKKVYNACIKAGVEADKSYAELHMLVLATEKDAA